MHMNDMGVLEAIMQLAGQEAFLAGYAEITPAHLAIALSRFSEGEVPNPTATLIAAVHQEFEAFGIQPRTFRHRLRGVLGKKEGYAGGGAIQASVACKGVLACAERTAAHEQVPVQPRHMVRALFLFLAECGEPAKEGLPDNERPQTLEDIPTEL
jgi:hypothetical protein